MTPFRARWPDKTYFELAYEACHDALIDAGITIADIDSAVYGIYNDLFERQFMPDIYVNDYLGNIDKPGTRVTTGGATGGFTVRTAFAEVASGLADICLCLGVEKCNDCYDKQTGTTTPEVLKAIAYSADMTWEFPLGMLAACRLSHLLGFLCLPVVERVERLLNRFGLPTKLVEPIQTDRILRTIRSDKKVRHGRVRFVFLEGVGRPSIRDNVPEKAVREAYETLLP